MWLPGLKLVLDGIYLFILFSGFFFLLGGGVLLGFAGPIGIKEPNEAGMYTIRESLGIF